LSRGSVYVSARRIRRFLVVGGALLILAGLALGWAAGDARLPVCRCLISVSFWAAGRLNSEGNDPYDPARLQVLQQEAEPQSHQVLVMWPAPWPLTLLGPLSRLDAHTAQACWLALLLTIYLERCSGPGGSRGGRCRPGRRSLAGCRELPADLSRAGDGTLGPLLLLGFVGFLHFQSAARRARGAPSLCWLP